MASPVQAGAFALEAGQRPIGLTTFAGYFATAGLVNSLIAGFLLCWLPRSQTPSLKAFLVRAVIYVSAATLAGWLGARFYWNRSATPFSTDPPLSFRLFALANASAWVWVPSVVLLSRQDSPGSLVVAALAAALLATGLRRIVPLDGLSFAQHEAASQLEERELFAATLETYPREPYGYVIAGCIYAAFYALHDRSPLAASALSAVCAFIFAWKLTLAPNYTPRNRNAHDGRRLIRIALPAVLVTLFVLAYGIDSRNRASIADAEVASGNGHGNNTDQKSQRRVSGSGISGYESIILWPVPRQKEIVAPVLATSSPFGIQKDKPLIIRFDGSYWYFQAPGKEPSPTAHQDHGTPLAVDIHSNNFIPLTMEAHQSLGAAIRLARCREIQVAIENRDNRPGAITLAVLLKDSASPNVPSLYLGQQPVASSQPDQFSVKSSPVNEVLRFPIPGNANMRKFDEITIMFLPDMEHIQVGPKIAIQEFHVIPR
jgi:hypothetical protein